MSSVRRLFMQNEDSSYICHDNMVELTPKQKTEQLKNATENATGED